MHPLVKLLSLGDQGISDDANLPAANEALHWIDLLAMEGAGLAPVSHLPMTLRILL